MNNSFAQNLKELRKENKLSQKDVAKIIDVTQQCVSEWEKGNMEPTLSNLWRLADLFDISIDALIGRTEF
ncbi:MAG TPA: helix-turn-helix transcriptional regulator [Candidatus Borkfalkia avistercoris]|uniref:Helix-turn-helix transcriptional regulator n=1 Tax=Candidatus Borkfalkia avistercoris TaxID=2838504 RepID=A0A9D2CYX1_9FIRM|nr:helix-turn-helix transcriptional regulator [Candidatus Borkfalkia avistercoris]